MEDDIAGWIAVVQVEGKTERFIAGPGTDQLLGEEASCAGG